MAEEKNASQDESTEEQTEERQTVTAEQFDELMRKLEETRKAQAGSDKKVSELQRLLDQEREEKETATKTAEQQFAERLAALEKRNAEAQQKARRAELKSGAMELLNGAGLKPPPFFDRLIGDDEDATKGLVNAYIEDKKATLGEGAQQFAKQNGRTVTDTSQKSKPLTYQDLVAMSEDDYERVPPEVRKKILAGE